MRLTTARGLASCLDRYGGCTLTYAEVGATAGPLPDGYAHLRRRGRVGAGSRDLDRAGEALLGWEMHRRAGLAVAATGPAAEGGTVVLGLGAAAVLVIPCRVVRVVDDERRRGFAYGTLPGHPERGEELFLASLADDGSVWFEVTAFSRPGSTLIRLAGPAASAVQRVATSCYQRALAALVAEGGGHV